jgi:hypothetical protein
MLPVASGQPQGICLVPVLKRWRWRVQPRLERLGTFGLVSRDWMSSGFPSMPLLTERSDVDSSEDEIRVVHQSCGTASKA